MTRIISPPVSELDKLRQPLTKGERLVFELFRTRLDDNWEIYIQPHMNGCRPDFVLLKPDVGIAVFEVKDWNLDKIRYSVTKDGGRAPRLLVDDGKNKYSRLHPLEQVMQYKDEIYHLYCPRLKAASGLGVISAGVIFPFEPRTRIMPLFPETDYPRLYPVTGREAVDAGDIDAIFPQHARGTDARMNADLAQDFRNWLVDPDFSATQRRTLDVELDATQRALIAGGTKTGYRRIRGPAGSGKSLVLAARAAELASQGKDVLVVTFNITLINYLSDVAIRHKGGAIRKSITWLNVHHWWKRVAQELDSENEYGKIWRRHLALEAGQTSDDMSAPNAQIAALIGKLLDQDLAGRSPKYDAIIVDEAQDFLPEWWNVLRKAAKPGGEMLLAADVTQDIYGTARAWTELAMTGCGFTGRWSELKVSYRLPPDLIPHARYFAERFLDDTRIVPLAPQLELNIFPCALRWIQTSRASSASVCSRTIKELVIQADPDPLAFTDIVFMVDNQKTGLRIVEDLTSSNIRVVHTFSEDKRESRRKKLAFFAGGARAKAITMHSFKGWESRAVVMFIGKTVSPDAMALIYTGMTRLKRHQGGSYLTVVCSAPDLREYGRTWPEFIQQ